ncbi:ribosomal protein L7/L12 [Brucella pseudogrignonensis]|uniref:ribosomal protein L7/L12 n=1 Tax=Brucella pseudogrignonensis TaxID=419475 RepID=UPI0028B95703|nr:ribosomal protein L7/L12 [Brucella pseudogrignonensis]MDT6941899.1 ribosomal protein L7/L12 [Brucella pseudogrignonensis]
MGNVKVGDKVRSLVTQIDVRAGELYEVKTVDDGDVWVIDDVGDDFYLTADEFEILPVEEASEDKPAFKVGDRVQMIADSLPWYRTGEIAEVIRADGGDNDCYVRFDTHRMADDCWYAKWDHLKLAPLKIEAGKYYCTRDGRKAGPLMARNNDSYAFAADIAGDIGIRIFQKDGVHGSRWIGNEPNLDLIAEWVDEPVKAAAPVQFILRNDVFSFAPVAKPAIVALIENGQPKPSTAPYVHANETLATKEAARLASLQKGKEFGVYVMTQKVSEPAPSYKHEWQRLAAKGEKISAIKELRSVTGLGLRAAKDAVEHWIAHDEPYSRIAA